MNISSLVGHIVELANLVENNAQPADRIVGEFFRSRKYLGARDRRFISQVVYGLVRFQTRLEALVEQFRKENLPTTLSQGQKLLLRYVAYAISIEKANPEDITASLAGRWKTVFPDVDLRPLTGWLSDNASLDFLAGDDIQQLAVWYSFQEWMVREWVGQLGQDETEELLNALNSEAPVFLRVNTLKTNTEECRNRLGSEGIQAERSAYSPVGLVSAKRFNVQSCRSFKEGLFEVQDEGSQIVCLLAGPRPDSFVIDACAGAGGKSLMLAGLMENRGKILALDTEPKRLRELETRARRSGTTIIAAHSRAESGDLKDTADLVLVDAPCSGVGTIRRNPWMKWSVTESLVDHYAQLQSRILEEYSFCVKPGGRLVYSTCSLFRKENEQVIEAFLPKHPEFVPAVPMTILSLPGIEGEKNSHEVKLLPHKYGTDGFFIAVLQKKG